MNRKTKADIILIMVLLILGSAVLLYMYSRPVEKEVSMRLAIGVHGERVFDEALDELELPYTYTAVNAFGETNIFIIEEDEDGTIGVRCDYSDCDNQLCVYMGVMNTPDFPIVCLPHGVIARLYMPEEN